MLANLLANLLAIVTRLMGSKVKNPNPEPHKGLGTPTSPDAEPVEVGRPLLYGNVCVHTVNRIFSTVDINTVHPHSLRHIRAGILYLEGESYEKACSICDKR